MMKFNGKSVITKLAQPGILIAIGAFSRLIPHPANFAPITAMALFGGVYLTKKQALTLPIAAMILSDFFLGFDSVPMRLSVYGSFILAVLVGFWVKNHKNPKHIIFASILSSILFFIITNFAVWAFGSMYPKSVTGLMQSYFFAIPFFRNSVLGDLFYSGVFFGIYNLLLNSSPRVALAQKP
ncbi:hypothetical protein A2208_02580 [Candidatus Woesebacteria bacterium RIFOXYA1_FULL_43_16]|uniref:Rod shape-determining protein MreD n=1 Tax=Candidatus Woesebacteria bacterium RIFOXYD1_FULL_43_18 TaxID=1802551 RepID=A0A1F8DK85_9BACT|nr:MAG: hypothetical protein A2208_02580 [Candidatus Woesebacteria bacterium RIFOXYA1_FULL_43_16]OGM83978.1 MAG: hypothetical protein A2421_03460 [Candidatus Woesebacteria bacterium RIFOXYC1_FULL_43_18]OGM88419.1 MAG: hypothetical protein A2573_02450 [Candidatus Woesebacteria bacterium RIFOXYD1_FULL_43_18]